MSGRHSVGSRNSFGATHLVQVRRLPPYMGSNLDQLYVITSAYRLHYGQLSMDDLGC